MKNIKISIGDATRGYDSALVIKTENGKYRLIADTVSGRVSIIRKSIATLNRGDDTYVTAGGEYLPINLSNV